MNENIILKVAYPKRTYILTTDASNLTIAAVLSQWNDNGDEDIVTFISRTLKGSEHIFFTTEKELLAIVWSLQRLDMYVKGAKQIVIRTDRTDSGDALIVFQYDFPSGSSGYADRQELLVKLASSRRCQSG